ncbi:MAG: CPBP family intramembrane metalloprotease [Rikenellaceae bacterium]|nr:CPBP family intramembrane metalloprotease [Rikenellaceae bacterium]
MAERKGVTLPIIVAALLWFVMFSPWTAPHVNFWVTMALSGVVLTGLATWCSPELREQVRGLLSLRNVALGVAIAVALWGVFWIGEKVAVWMFPFAEGQIGSIYSMKQGTNPWIIGALLLLVIGPAEELFWRGFVQQRLGKRWGPWMGFVATTAVYALVHIWSLNFMLVASAAVVGGAWGLIYRFWPKGLGALVVSHAVWDVAVFLLFPI